MRASSAPGLAGVLVIMVSTLAGSACSATPDLSFGDDGDGDAAPDARVPTFGAGGNGGIARGDAGSSVMDSGAPRAVDAGAAPDAATPPPALDAAAPPPARDASSPPTPDAGPPPTVDAGPPVLTCPDVPPAGADLCCGAVPCVGKKCAQVCAACSACAGRVCCAAPNGKSATCAATTSACTKSKGQGAVGDEDDESALADPSFL